MPAFGVMLSHHPAAEQFELVRRVEDLGFESVWTGDHLSFHHPLYESLTLLASYASITRRIRLGTSVYLLALRSPAVAAKTAATVDVLSGGRLIFGVGVGGENPKEFQLAGVPHRERGARVNEGIDVVRTLWRDTPASWNSLGFSPPTPTPKISRPPDRTSTVAAAFAATAGERSGSKYTETPSRMRCVMLA